MVRLIQLGVNTLMLGVKRQADIYIYIYMYIYINIYTYMYMYV